MICAVDRVEGDLIAAFRPQLFHFIAYRVRTQVHAPCAVMEIKGALMDVVFIAVIGLFAALSWGLALLCERV